MGTYKVIDCDGHVADPFEMYTEMIDPEFKERVPKRIDVDGKRTVIVDGKEFPNFVKYGERPLGKGDESEPLPRPVQSSPIAEGGVNPHVRMKDMDREGIDVAVLFPSGTPSMCAVQDPQLESALYRAYNRWLADYCAPYPERLKGVAVVSMREAALGVKEIKRVAKDNWMVGVLVAPHMDDFNLDHPRLNPIWETAQEYDLPICIHAGCGRPPYALGTNESGNNLFMMHAMAHPFEQMRAVAAVMGGGVLDRYPRLRIAFLESGVGWVPWWIDRLEEHAEKLPKHVPLMAKDPKKYAVDGQCFFACEPDEPMLEAVIDQIGDDHIVYASDYPHWDCSYPTSREKLANRPTLSESSKEKILGKNAARLYRLPL